MYSTPELSALTDAAEEWQSAYDVLTFCVGQHMSMRDIREAEINEQRAYEAWQCALREWEMSAR